MTMMEIEGVEVGAVAVVGAQERSRIEILVSLARSNKRSVDRFRKDAQGLCCTNEEVAQQCLYALPRTKAGGEQIAIEGPSVRMAEILIASWKNSAVSGIVIESGPREVVAQATFIDFENLTMISRQVRARVLGTHGDAQQLAENRAVSIAIRNVILTAIPRALWEEAYQAARSVVAGDIDTLEKRRTEVLVWLESKKVTLDRVLNALGVEGVGDIGLEQLATLRALVYQVRQGDMTADAAFPKPNAAEEERGKGVEGLASKLTKTSGATGTGTETGPVTDAKDATGAPPKKLEK